MEGLTIKLCQSRKESSMELMHGCISVISSLRSIELVRNAKDSATIDERTASPPGVTRNYLGTFIGYVSITSRVTTQLG
jgi:hypothetical protein